MPGGKVVVLGFVRRVRGVRGVNLKHRAREKKRIGLTLCERLAAVFLRHAVQERRAVALDDRLEQQRQRECHRRESLGLCLVRELIERLLKNLERRRTRACQQSRRTCMPEMPSSSASSAIVTSGDGAVIAHLPGARRR